MIFIALILAALFFYVRGYKISALLIFFFYVTGGFNLIPDEVVDLGVPLTKNADYAFFLLFGLLTVGFLFTRNFFRVDTFVKLLALFFIFLLICIVYNRYVLGIAWSEIIRTVRFLSFWLAYFVFRSLEKEQLLGLLKSLFVVTVCASVLYLFQLVIGKNILVETATTSAFFFGYQLPRFYNQPALLHFFVFMAIYYNPFKGSLKILTIVILTLALFAAFHRSLSGFFLLALAFGFFLKLPKMRRVQISVAALFALLFLTIFAAPRFAKSRTFADLKKVSSGNVIDADIDINDLSDATFTFRVAHFLEREEHIRRNISSVLFGGALLTEDSKKLDRFFDFKVGLIEELTGEVGQVDTADISYSFLIIRFGYLGTLLYMLLYIYFIYFFFRNRKESPLAFFSLIYLIMIMGVSLFATNLIFTVTFLMPMISYLVVRKEKSKAVSEVIEE